MARGKAVPLTDSKIKSAPVGSTWDSVQPGLLVVVTKKKRRMFRVRYDLDGKQRFKVLGDYPMLTLDKARLLAYDIREKAKQGAPAVVAGDITVADVVDQFLRNDRYPLCKLSKCYREQWYGRYNRAFLEPIGNLEPSKIPQQVLMDIVEDQVDLGKIGEAQARQLWIGTFYKNLKFHRNYKGSNRVENPIKGEAFTKYEQPDRQGTELSEDEIRGLYHPAPLYNSVVQLLIFTGQRVGRVLAMKWTDIEDGVWCVGKKGEMKNKRTAHYLPWLDEFEDLVKPFRDNGSKYVFVLGDNPKPIRHTTIYDALHEIDSRYYPHLLRHTFGTHVSKIIHPYDVPLILHHSNDSQRNNTSEQTYMHDQQLERKREALQAWVDWIFQLRCKYEPYPEAQDYAVECGVERGNFDAPPDPLEEVLKTLTDEQRAVLMPLLPASSRVSKVKQAKTLQEASIQTDWTYLVGKSKFAPKEALNQLSVKYHMPPDILATLVEDIVVPMMSDCDGVKWD